MTAEERAKAIIEHFAASLPPAVRPELENVIARAIKRAVNQELAKLERLAEMKEERAHGRGKSAKGHDAAAIHFHREWKERFRIMRNGTG
jgi:ribosomal protein L19E